MCQEIRDKLRKERYLSIFTVLMTLLFESKQMYSSINIHHKTLNDCLASVPYLAFLWI